MNKQTMEVLADLFLVINPALFERTMYEVSMDSQVLVFRLCCTNMHCSFLDLDSSLCQDLSTFPPSHHFC